MRYYLFRWPQPSGLLQQQVQLLGGQPHGHLKVSFVSLITPSPRSIKNSLPKASPTANYNHARDRRMKESLGRDFNRVWGSGLITNLADGVLKLAAPLLAITLTEDPVKISLLSALALLPWLFFAIPIGGIVDRIDGKLALVVGNLVRSVVAILLAYAVFQEAITVELLLLSVFLIGICEVLVDTTSQAMIPSLLKSDQLERGNSRLNTSEVIIAQFVGTPLSGFLYAIAISLPFFLSGIGFVIAAIIIGLTAFQINPKPVSESDKGKGRFTAELKEGIRYMYEEKRIFHLVVITTGLGFFFSLATAISPLFIVKELGVAPRYFGLLIAIQGIGALVGSLLAPRISERLGRGRALSMNLLIASVPVVLIGLAPNVWFFVPLSVITGATISIWNVLLMSAYQSLIPRELYGRIHGARRTIVWGLMPLGSVAGGFIALGGLRLPYIVGGVISLIIVLVSYRRIVEIGNSSSQIYS